MKMVDRDEPLGAFARGGIHAGHHRKPASQRAQEAAAAAGICA
jgi:hypothetical protein